MLALTLGATRPAVVPTWALSTGALSLAVAATRLREQKLDLVLLLLRKLLLAQLGRRG